jgi:hypothetical protein
MCNCGDKNCDYRESELYWHELLDRSHVICDSFHKYIEDHPVVKHNKGLQQEAEKVTRIIQDFYQLVSSKSYNFDLNTGKI